MKNYPLNPFVNKFYNWTKTYLQELNSKVWALKNYSDFFLTDYVESTIDFLESFILQSSAEVEILNLATLSFHQYAYIDRDCFIETDSTDINATRYEGIDGKIKYLRPIAAGTIIVSNARPEGSIDSGGMFGALLRIWVVDLGEESILTATTGTSESILTFNSFRQGSAHPERINWRNFIIQPTGFASLYLGEPAENGLVFRFYEKGGEDYGTTLNFALLFQNARYEYLGRNEALTFTQYNNGITLYSYSNTAQPLIATATLQGGTIPWLARSNPLMFFLYYGRQRGETDASTVYGEEIITDATFEVGATKLETVNTLYYNINIKETLPPSLLFTTEVL